MSKTDAARKRFVGAKRAQAQAEPPSIEDAPQIAESVLAVVAKPQSAKQGGIVATQVPDDILFDEALNEAIKLIPSNYNFEIHKSVWQVKKNNATRVALQFPEGLLMYSLTICDILARFTGVETVVMGDVTYGACCIDDFTAKALGCDFMIHYGHSCLVPVTVTSIKTLYVFVEIGIDTAHFVETVQANFDRDTHLVLVATIQFTAALQSAKRALDASGSFAHAVTIPQTRPLSPGEILGCTSPRIALADKDEEDAAARTAIVYLGDGRFHLESIMISNPRLAAYRYDPYAKKFTRELYDHAAMRRMRSAAISSVESRVRAAGENGDKTDCSRKGLVGIIIGTLGRQGSPKVISRMREMVPTGVDSVYVLLSEISAEKLKALSECNDSTGRRTVDSWIQSSCPRLSIDWGHSFGVPLLSPYEAAVAFGRADGKWRNRSDETELKEVYPMDYYAKASSGDWTPNYTAPSEQKRTARERR
ncbi:Diphthamide biosynthesis protein 1 [Entophlyctis luteolus]|nr:Diphthamide biosynthesis protein 1 [Entophlyctis luteolus]